MKFPILLLLALSFNCQAEEIKIYKKLNSSQAEVVIQTAQQDGIQTAAYVDGGENDHFVSDLMSDKKSLLNKLKRQIEMENCEQTSTDETTQIPGCGEVQLTNFILTSFGRGGWDSAGAAYTFFIGFRQEGTGRFFDVSHMVTISESVLAQTTEDGSYAGKIIKTLNFGKITRIDEH